MVGILLAAFSFAAALMGAGFASGQETVTFFAVFSQYGVVGIVIASVLIGLFGGVVSEYALRFDCDYNEIVSRLFPCRVCRAVDVVTFSFSICTIAVMCACFGELCETFLGLGRAAGAFFLAVISATALLTGKEGSMKLNALLGIIIFIFAAALCLYLLGYREHQTFNAVDAAASGVVYAGYNLISAGAVLAAGRGFLRNRGDGYLMGVASGLMVLILLTLMWGIISVYYGKIDLGELPMITLAMRESHTLAVIYAAVMGAAVFTTALSNGLCASQYISNIAGRKYAVLICMALGFSMSGAGFSTLVATVYKYSGMIGMIIASVVVYRAVKRMTEYEKRRF